MNYGYPATVSSGSSKSVPVYGAFKAPFGYGKFGKPFGFGKIGKPFGFGKTGKFPSYGYGYPATKGSSYASKVPVTSVVTSPFPGV